MFCNLQTFEKGKRSSFFASFLFSNPLITYHAYKLPWPAAAWPYLPAISFRNKRMWASSSLFSISHRGFFQRPTRTSSPARQDIP